MPDGVRDGRSNLISFMNKNCIFLIYQALTNRVAIFFKLCL